MKKTARYVLPAVFLMILPIMVFAGEINLPKTGQTTCYNVDGVVIGCAGTGQDGDIQAGVEWPSPRFNDNNDGTLTDNLTGLMWLKDGNCFGKRTWQGALDVMKDFNINPLSYNCSDYTDIYDDWRLPNVLELESLANAEKMDSTAWLNTLGFTNVQNCRYWSATTDASDSNYALNVYIYLGDLVGDCINCNDKSYNYCVWAVRAGQ